MMASLSCGLLLVLLLIVLDGDDVACSEATCSWHHAKERVGCVALWLGSRPRIGWRFSLSSTRSRREDSAFG